MAWHFIFRQYVFHFSAGGSCCEGRALASGVRYGSGTDQDAALSEGHPCAAEDRPGVGVGHAYVNGADWINSQQGLGLCEEAITLDLRRILRVQNKVVVAGVQGSPRNVGGAEVLEVLQRYGGWPGRT